MTMIRFDNIAPIPLDNPIGKAALRFQASLEEGTAVVWECRLYPIPLPKALRPGAVPVPVCWEDWPATYPPPDGETPATS